MILFYNIFLFLYKYAIRFVAIWNPKARLWATGRIGIFKKIRKAGIPDDKKTVWMHCASLGEYEQGKPVVQKLQEEYPDINIIITFFSPSGYEIIKKKNEFKFIFYLPEDSYLHARKWIKKIRPDLVLWVKYEYWHYYLHEIKRKNIPLLLISGVYRPGQIFFKWYGGFYRNMLGSFTHFFLQNHSSSALLEKITDPKRITVAGDTRCDRVIQTVNHFTPVPGISQFCENAKVVVAGSTWEEDEILWTHFVKNNPDMRFIFAPHEIDQQNLNDLKSAFPGAVLYSEWMANPEMQSSKKRDIQPPGFFRTATGIAGEEEGKYPVTNCLIIDNIGMLSRLYHYAHIAYVGGGFGADGLHNILEAAVFGIPVIYGPHHHKNFEAIELKNTSGGIVAESAVELEEIVYQLLNNENERTGRGEAAKNYIFKNAGASQKIIDYIKGRRFLDAS